MFLLKKEHEDIKGTKRTFIRTLYCARRYQCEYYKQILHPKLSLHSNNQTLLKTNDYTTEVRNSIFDQLKTYCIELSQIQLLISIENA